MRPPLPLQVPRLTRFAPFHSRNKLLQSSSCGKSKTLAHLQGLQQLVLGPTEHVGRMATAPPPPPPPSPPPAELTAPLGSRAVPRRMDLPGSVRATATILGASAENVELNPRTSTLVINGDEAAMVLEALLRCSGTIARDASAVALRTKFLLAVKLRAPPFGGDRERSVLGALMG